MEQHRGEIVEQVVRESGFPMKKLAQQLEISRNTLYNRFRNPNLSYEFIKKVSDIIHYDLSLHFPEMKEKEIQEEKSVDYTDRYTAELVKLERKYTSLLERYNKLLSTLVRLANDNELYTIKKEILRFIEEKGL